MLYSCLVGKSLYWVLWQTEEELKTQFLFESKKDRRVCNGFLRCLPEWPTEWRRLRFLQSEKPPLLSESKWANREEIIFRLTSDCLTKIYPTGLKWNKKCLEILRLQEVMVKFPSDSKHCQVQKRQTTGSITWTEWAAEKQINVFLSKCKLLLRVYSTFPDDNKHFEESFWLQFNIVRGVGNFSWFCLVTTKIWRDGH